MPQDVSLICHSVHPQSVELTVRVAASRTSGLSLKFQLIGASNLLIPRPVDLPGFVDGLWQHTCFEVFVAYPGARAYHEFNFSPSGQWAAYAFNDYRQRDMRWEPSKCPKHFVTTAENSVCLEAAISSELLSLDEVRLELGLSAVLETTDGALSYWALAHPSPRPDFHRREAFSLGVALES